MGLMNLYNTENAFCRYTWTWSKYNVTWPEYKEGPKFNKIDYDNGHCKRLTTYLLIKRQLNNLHSHL